MNTWTIMEHFSDLPDPRTHLLKNRHKLIDIIVIAVCAVICGAEDWVSVPDFGKAKEEWLSTFLELPNGIPSHDTFGRVYEERRTSKADQPFEILRFHLNLRSRCFTFKF